MHDGIYAESEVEVAHKVQELIYAKKKKRNAKSALRIQELREQWALKRQKDQEYEQEIDRIRINDYDVEMYEENIIMNMREGDSDLQALGNREIGPIGEGSEENKGKKLSFLYGL